MAKLWYPVAVSALVVGCGGSVDSGSPTTGGVSGIDTGYPTETGGLFLGFYGPPPMGGASSTSGGTTSLGGTTAVGGSTSTSDDQACTSDSDCTQCVYITAPSNSNQCTDALGCCGGQVINQTTCAINQAAWEANCSGQGYTIPICPCVSLANSTLSCKNGECGFW